jgi:hydrogenase maturation protein HypF
MNAHAPSSKFVPGRLRIRVRGRVQGVGFRPFVWGLARRHALTGFVLNDAEGVLIEAEGPRLEAFLAALRNEAPPLARIDTVDAEAIAIQESKEFAIVETQAGARVSTEIGPDTSICDACLKEIFTPDARRYLYPFTTCTHCGPRLTVTARLPYDRAQTSLAPFPLCGPCAAEYADPADRRFHAETTACPDCGPTMDMDPAAIWTRIAQGQIIAVKGLGGFHLICDARSDATVAKLRRRKQREAKPFAVMALNLASAQRLIDADPTTATALTSRQRPIVVAPAKRNHGLAPSVAFGLPSLGVMLPYTPLHYLIFHAALGAPSGTDWLDRACEIVLIATSANPHDEPLVIDGAEAQARLNGIADAIADHDRTILIRADDSVMRVIDGAPAFLRRARGFVPEPIDLGFDAPSIIAFGAQLKNTICVTREREAFVSQHIGDLGTAPTRRFLQETAKHIAGILDVKPAFAAHDLHPDFASTLAAQETGLSLHAVQHHHAHIAAIAAEHKVTGPLLGVALDGYGLGSDGGAWGGELLRCDGAVVTRIGHLAPLPAPGGDLAAREPWRMAAGVLSLLGRMAEIDTRFTHPQRGALVRLLAAGRVPRSSSMGRWFDAACGILGVNLVSVYEGQAPMMLEALVKTPAVLDGGWRIENGILDFLPLMAALIDAGQSEGAELAHGTFAAGLADWIETAAREQGLRTVALGGGCFQNRVLTESLIRRLARTGLTVLKARALPCNDGGVSLGQAFVAAHVFGGS